MAKSNVIDSLSTPSFKIVVADRRFVFAGMTRIEDGFVIIEDCVCIRYWGTPSNNTGNSGLGYLAKFGKTKETRLDPQPTTVIPMSSIAHLIDSVVIK